MAVTYDSVGTGVIQLNSATASWPHTLTNLANCITVSVTVFGDGADGFANYTRTCSIGTTALTSLGVVNCNNSGGWVEIFGLIGVIPVGAQTINYSCIGGHTPYVSGNSVAYQRVATFGTSITKVDTVSTALTTPAIASATGNIVLGALMIGEKTSGKTISAPTGTQRFNSGTATTNYTSLLVEDTPGAASITMYATANASSSWASVGVNLTASASQSWLADVALLVNATTSFTITDVSFGAWFADTSLVVSANSTAATPRTLSLQSVGAVPANSLDLANLAYTNTWLAANISQGQINTLIAGTVSPPTGFAPYVLKSYVDARKNGAGALLATPGYVDTGNATKIPLTQINANSGVPGLGVGGRIAVDRLNVASTQRFPHAFWSPAAYNSAAVAATTEVNVYSCTISDPGFVYKVLVTGLVSANISLDNGEFPVIRVRQGNATTGQIVAGGFGTGESYVGAPPGAEESQMYYAGSQAAVSTYTTLTPWTAVNAGDFTTTLSGNFIQVLQSVSPATLSASMTWTGATGNGTTAIRIIRSDNTVVATGTGVAGDSGTCTVSGTRAIVSGELYTVQGSQTVGFGTHGSWVGATSNTLTLGPTPVPNQGEINIIPQPTNVQTSITGATTLYVNVERSGAAATATVSTVFPKLCVLTVPA